jgi:hypothetical protein
MGSVPSMYTKKCCKASSGDLRHLRNFKAARKCFILIEVLIPYKSFKTVATKKFILMDWSPSQVPIFGITSIPLTPYMMQLQKVRRLET